MDTDRELLEWAAKAAGIKYVAMDNWPHQDSCRFWKHGDFCDCGAAWDPLTDDGDAFRLAVKLDVSIDVEAHEQSTYVYAGITAPRAYAMEMWGDDKNAATRRAIVRAAAELGKSAHPPKGA